MEHVSIGTLENSAIAADVQKSVSDPLSLAVVSMNYFAIPAPPSPETAHSHGRVSHTKEQGVRSGGMHSVTLQDDPSVESFFDVVETETLASFEHLSFEFLEEFDVFAPAETRRTREHDPPEMMRGFLRCYTGHLRHSSGCSRTDNRVVRLNCGFDRPPSRDAVDRFLTDLEHGLGRV